MDEHVGVAPDGRGEVTVGTGTKRIVALVVRGILRTRLRTQEQRVGCRLDRGPMGTRQGLLERERVTRPNALRQATSREPCLDEHGKRA